MVGILLALYAAIVYAIAVRWFLEGFKKSNKDESGKIFGGIIFLIITALVACYFFNFMYPVVIMLGIVMVSFISLGLSFLNEELDVFMGSTLLFGVLVLLFGLFSGFLMITLMVQEGWYTTAACVVSGYMVFLGLNAIRKFSKINRFSISYLITFLILLAASVYLTWQYAVDHLMVLTACTAALLIYSFVGSRRGESNVVVL